jgi:glucose-1-phosphate adenylyltransferase
MKGVRVGRHARIRRAIIDEGVSIPSYYTIGYNLEEDRKKFTVTDSGIVVIPQGSIID